MTKRHDAVFDDVLSNLGETPEGGRAGARFLSRQARVADRFSGDVEEKSLRWVDPAQCRMWDRHNRAYDLLTPENCRDLIDGIRAQGRQEFPAIVRATGDAAAPYEVICGARRHFAVTWLRANNYPQFKYLVDIRDLTDEEAFRLADIENRDRQDISDYERAKDYAEAVRLYYGGKQRAMAERLEVSEAWLSRYLQLAKLPETVVKAYGDVREIKEIHARHLKPLLRDPESRALVLAEARVLGSHDHRMDGAQVLSRLRAAAAPKAAPAPAERYEGPSGGSVEVKRTRGKVKVEFDADLPRSELMSAFARFVREHYGEP
ncbi:MAG: ParB/RepB/Spo0J family partition protein [Shimia sp.]